MSDSTSERQKILNHPGSPSFYGSSGDVNVVNPNQSAPPDLVTQVAGHTVRDNHNFSEPEQRGTSSYVEFLGGSVPCPTCRGVGSISKEQEGQLVALIPLKDKRLKPRRTYLYVALAVFLCLSVGGLLTFFMFPRSVILVSNKPFLPPENLTINTKKGSVHFHIKNFVNITNNNYFSVYVSKVEMTSLFREKVINTNSTNTHIEVRLRRKSLIDTFAKITFDSSNDLGYMASLCSDTVKWFHHFSMIFQFTISYSYLGHTEQTSLTTYQTVSCGNDTTITTPPPQENTTIPITTVPVITLNP